MSLAAESVQCRGANPQLGWMSYQSVWGLRIFIGFGGVRTIWGPGPMQIWALFWDGSIIRLFAVSIAQHVGMIYSANKIMIYLNSYMWYSMGLE
jgi:hypothetical protein